MNSFQKHPEDRRINNLKNVYNLRLTLTILNAKYVAYLKVSNKLLC